MSHLSGTLNDAEEHSWDFTIDCFALNIGISKIFWIGIYLQAFIWLYSYPQFNLNS